MILITDRDKNLIYDLKELLENYGIFGNVGYWDKCIHFYTYEVKVNDYDKLKSLKVKNQEAQWVLDNVIDEYHTLKDIYQLIQTHEHLEDVFKIINEKLDKNLEKDIYKILNLNFDIATSLKLFSELAILLTDRGYVYDHNNNLKIKKPLPKLEEILKNYTHKIIVDKDMKNKLNTIQEELKDVCEIKFSMNAEIVREYYLSIEAITNSMMDEQCITAITNLLKSYDLEDEEISKIIFNISAGISLWTVLYYGTLQIIEETEDIDEIVSIFLEEIPDTVENTIIHISNEYVPLYVLEKLKNHKMIKIKGNKVIPMF